MPDSIGTLGEKSLHAQLKRYLSAPDDLLECEVDGYVVDIVRGDLLIEIQTRNFAAVRRKLDALVQTHEVRLVHPIAVQRWIVKLDEGRIDRRKSPRKGHVTHVFRELVRLPHLIAHPRFSLEVLLVADEEIRVNDGQGSWRRRGWSIQDRRLLDVQARVVLASPADLAGLLPDDLPPQFTTAELAQALKQPRAVAQKMAYCLRTLGCIEITDKRGNALVYARSTSAE